MSFQNCRLAIECSQHSLPLYADLPLLEVNFQAGKFRGKVLHLDLDEVGRKIAPFATRLVRALETGGRKIVVEVVDVPRSSLLHTCDMTSAFPTMIVLVPFSRSCEDHSVLSLVMAKD